MLKSLRFSDSYFISTNLGSTFRYIYTMRMTLQAIEISNRSIRVRFDCLCSERPPACCKGSPMTNRLLDSSMPISSPAPHRSRFACLPRTCDRAATQLPASFNPMQQPPLVLALGWTLHARRKSLKARARPSCRALDEQRVARRPTVPSVQHCPGADRARRHPPALLLIPSCQGRLVCSVGKLLSEMIWCLLLLVQCGRHGRRCAAWG